MTNSLQVLKEYNDWRRGVGKYEVNNDTDHVQLAYSPAQIGQAIDAVITELTILRQEITK